MAELLKNVQGFLGGAKSSVSSAVIAEDSDFADFATAASPAAPSHAATSSFTAATTGKPGLTSGWAGLAGRPYTKWYRVWERVTIADFYQEMIVLPIILSIVFLNLWGASANRSRAQQWAKTYFPIIESEYASIGFGGRKTEDVAQTLPKGSIPKELLKEKSKSLFVTYATGRQNVAWLDVKLSLYPRYNPFLWLAELVLSFLFDMMPAPVERVEATAFCFDGKEKAILPSQVQGNKDSSYDSFVWAIVHKDKMKQLRDDRYDLSLTVTKDHPKLPIWATIMSESALVTDALLTPELISAVTEAGEDLEALIISDQPIDAPKKLDDTVPRKRVSLAMRLSTSSNSTALFSYFLRLPDLLVTTAHFRPDALRKIKATREDEIRKLRKIDEDEKAEERRVAADKLKKEERDRKLSKLSAEEQRKFLEKEKEKGQRRSMKKQSVRG